MLLCSFCNIINVVINIKQNYFQMQCELTYLFLFARQKDPIWKLIFA